METLKRLYFQNIKRRTLISLFMAITGLLIIFSYSMTNKGVTNDVRPFNRYITKSFKVQPNRSLSQLPDLKLLNWPIPPVAETPAAMYLEDGVRVPLPKPLLPIMSKGQRELFYELLKIISDIMFNHSMGDRFMISYGTHIGSMRHHDFIPWDDDADVLMDVEVRPKVRSLLQRLAPDYVLYEAEFCDRFATKSMSRFQNDLDLPQSRSVGEIAWPFMDITYFEVINGQIVDTSQTGASWPISSVYPLYYRPFGKYWFPAPRNLLQVHNGVGSECETHFYSHALQTVHLKKKIACKSLTSRYAFVRRRLCPGYSRDEENADGMVMAEEQLSMMVDGQWHDYHRICLPVAAELVEYNPYIL